MLPFHSNYSPRRNRRGLTLIEVLIAATLFTLISTASFMVFVRGLGAAGGILRHNLVVGFSRAPLEHLKNRVRTGSALKVLDAGNRLQITSPGGNVSSYWMQTETADDGTTGSSLLFRENPEAQPERLLVLSVRRRIRRRSSLRLAWTP